MPSFSINIDGVVRSVAYDGSINGPEGLLASLNTLGVGVFFIVESGGQNLLTIVDDDNVYGEAINQPDLPIPPIPTTTSTTTTTTTTIPSPTSTTTTTTTTIPSPTTTSTTTTTTTTIPSPTTTSTTTTTTTTIPSPTTTSTTTTTTTPIPATFDASFSMISSSDVCNVVCTNPARPIETFTVLTGGDTLCDCLTISSPLITDGTITGNFWLSDCANNVRQFQVILVSGQFVGVWSEATCSLCSATTTTTSTTTTSTTSAPILYRISNCADGGEVYNISMNPSSVVVIGDIFTTSSVGLSGDCWSVDAEGVAPLDYTNVLENTIFADCLTCLSTPTTTTTSTTTTTTTPPPNAYRISNCADGGEVYNVTMNPSSVVVIGDVFNTNAVGLIGDCWSVDAEGVAPYDFTDVLETAIFADCFDCLPPPTTTTTTSTTTTSTTLPPVTLSLTPGCTSGEGSGTILANGFSGGTESFEYISISSTSSLDALNRLDNPATRTLIDGATEYTFTSLPNSTYYVAIMDFSGNKGVNSTIVSCVNTTTTTTTTTSTTTTTTTLPPVNFSNPTFVCNDVPYGETPTATVSVTGFTGGSGVYQITNTLFLTEAGALGGTFIDVVTPPVNYFVVENNTWWVAVRDKNNPTNKVAKQVIVSCSAGTTTTTTTTSTTTTTTTDGFIYFIADEYDCSNCTIIAADQRVAFPIGTSVTLNRYYRFVGWDGSSSYFVKSSTTAGGYVLLQTPSYLNCFSACNLNTTTTTTSTTTTTTTLPPTTSTTTTTTTPTPISSTEYEGTFDFGSSIPEGACSNFDSVPLVSKYAAESDASSVTIFYNDPALTSQFNGGNQYFAWRNIGGSDRISGQIDGSGVVSNIGLCA